MMKVRSSFHHGVLRISGAVQYATVHTILSLLKNFIFSAQIRHFSLGSRCHNEIIHTALTV